MLDQLNKTSTPSISTNSVIKGMGQTNKKFTHVQGNYVSNLNETEVQERAVALFDSGSQLLSFVSEDLLKST